MLISDLESLKTAFSWNTTAAEWSTIAVFAGLCIDVYVILAFEFKKDRRNLREVIPAAVASLVIALGVLGEWRFGHKATEASTQLQRQSEQRISVLGRETELAKVEQARLRAENLENERLIMPRHLPVIGDETPLSPISQLRKFQHVGLLVECVPDFEPRRLCKELFALFNSVKWYGQEIDRITTETDPVDIPDGLEIFTAVSEADALMYGKVGLQPGDRRASPPTLEIPTTFSTDENKLWWEAEALSWYLSNAGIDNIHIAASNPDLPNRYRLKFHLTSDVIFVRIGERPIQESIEMRRSHAPNLR